MIGVLLLVAVAVLLALTMRPRKPRKPRVYLSGGPQRVLSAADLYRAVRASMRMGERARAESETAQETVGAQGAGGLTPAIAHGKFNTGKRG